MYTMVYSDSSSQKICGLSNISASFCESEICQDLVLFPTSCHDIAAIEIAMFATNVVGSGASNEPLAIGTYK